MAEHPGFKTVARGIAAKRGVSMQRARKMLAAGTRRAGAAARRKNPRLNRVKGALEKALIGIGWELIKAAGRPVPKEQGAFSFDEPAPAAREPAKPAPRPTAEHREAAATVDRNKLDFKRSAGGGDYHNAHPHHGYYSISKTSEGKHSLYYRANKRLSNAPKNAIDIGEFDTREEATSAANRHHRDVTVFGHKSASNLMGRYAPESKPLASLRGPAVGPGGHTNLASYLGSRK